jgi:putative membrane protein
MIFASAAMIIIALLLFRELFKSTAKKGNSWPLLFFIVPLIMAFALPAESFDSSTGTIGDVQLSSGGSLSDNTIVAAQEPEETDNSAESSPAIEGDTAESKETDEYIPLQDGVLVMDSSNFYECLCAIYADMDKYKGTPVEVVGFVFNENESFADDEFVPARLMMVCCAADMQPVGLLCQYEKTSELKADSWVKVSGTIEEAEFEGETIPVIVAQSVEMTEEPDEAYVYPY